MESAISQEDKLIRVEDVATMTGLSRSGIYLAIRQGRFPGPIKVSTRSSRWLLSEIQRWIAAQVAERPVASVRTSHPTASRNH